MGDVTEITGTNVVVLPKFDHSVIDCTAPHLLMVLNSLNGDVSLFANAFGTDPQQALYQAETILKNDPVAYKAWRAAIRQNQLIRLRLLQCDALEKLEAMSNRVFNDKPADDLNFAKVVLADLFESAKQAVKVAPRRAGNDLPEQLDDNDEEDEEEAKRALEA
jgi:hypothetical protein